MIYKTKGIILKRQNFREADRILTIYTQKYGKISAIAKGVRRPLSKLGGHLELFYLTDLVLAEGKNLDIVTGAQIMEDFSHLRKNLKLTQQAYYLAELIDKLVKEDSPSPEIFKLFHQSLRLLDQNSDSLLLCYFELQLLSYLGHKPEVEVCVKCQKKLSPEKIFWSHELGGVFCKDCRQYSEVFLRVSKDVIKVIRLFLSSDISSVNKLKIDDETRKELEKIVDGFLGYVSEKEFYAKKYV